MILSDDTIRRYCMTLIGDRFAVTPMIEPFFERMAVSIEGGRALTFGLGPAGYDVRVEFDNEGLVQKEALQPGRFLLASTAERFSMPLDVLGMVKDKSSWARRGLTVQNTVIEPGWSGFLTLELKNIGDDHIELRRWDPIAQIVFHRIDRTVERPYNGKYQDQQRGPRKAR